MERKITVALCVLLTVFGAAGAGHAEAVADQVTRPAGPNESSLVQGYEAFKNGEWTSATFFLRKAVGVPANATAEAWYMLIMSEMYAENYSSAVADCNSFLSSYSDSSLISYVQYQKGRALHYLGQNEDAVLILSDFCHQNPDNEMYPSALYWIAECFYADYNFDTARTMYERIVANYPDDSKASDAEYKLDMISQREREQKLLYLLKMTSEEYLSSRESYEKQLKQYQTEDTVNLRKQLKTANARIAELEAAASDTIIAAKKATQSVKTEDPDVVALKAKAALLQRLLDESEAGGK